MPLHRQRLLHQRSLLHPRIPLLVCALALTATALLGASQIASGAARTIGIQPKAGYHGTTISPDTAAKRGLSCIQKADGKLECFDSDAEAAASPVAAEEKAKADGGSAPTAGVAKRKRHRARASVDCRFPSDAMAITQNRDFNYSANGWNIAGYARQNWYDMTGAYANSATSLSAGNHTGYLANGRGGSGQRLNIQINDCYYNMTYQAFNDKAESRYRN